MAVLHQWYCPEHDGDTVSGWTDDPPSCGICGVNMRIAIVRVNSPEWGSPRHIPHLRDEPFGSRSELESYTKANGMALGASAEKVGGARNEDHLNLGKAFSYAGSPKS